MKRSLQEVVELVVFGLIALLVGTGLLWLLGWLLSLGGLLFKAIAGLLWLLLRYIVPVAIVAGLVYFLVKALQDKQPAPAAAGGSATPPPAPPVPAPAAPPVEPPSQPDPAAPEGTSEKPKPRTRKATKPPAGDAAADGSSQGADANEDEHS